jgi:hypothetical protein
MEACLSDKIDGRCSDVKCRVAEVEHQTEERFIALEMSRTEAEAGHAEIQKRRRLSPRGCPRQPFPRAREVSWRNLWLSRGSSLWGSHPPPHHLLKMSLMALMGTASKHITRIMSLGLSPLMLISRSMVCTCHHPVLNLLLINFVCLCRIRHLIW